MLSSLINFVLNLSKLFLVNRRMSSESDKTTYCWIHAPHQASFPFSHTHSLALCASCHKTWVYEVGERRFLEEKGFSDPKRCTKARQDETSINDGYLDQSCTVYLLFNQKLSGPLEATSLTSPPNNPFLLIHFIYKRGRGDENPTVEFSQSH